MNNKKLALACVGAAILGFSSTFFFIGGHLTSQTKEVQHQGNDLTDNVPIQKNKLKKIAESDIYIPQYKDQNGVCGIAVNEDGKHVAVKSDNGCPTNEALAANYFYEYETLADSYRPKAYGDSCGYAHLVTEGARIGTKDMAKLNSMTQGDLNNVGVKPNGVLCPTQAELSDNISNSVGVPVRFEYNTFDVNPNNYPVLNVSFADMQTDILSSKGIDASIIKEQSGTNIISANGKPIPKILLMPDAKKLCGNNFSACFFDDTEMTLENIDTGQKYEITTHNGYVLPKFMMTKGAWDVCGGIFSQCDYTPDDEFPDRRGSLTNKITHKQYTSKPVVEIINENE